MESFDAVIIGGGAAGLFCAATAGQRGRRVAVLDHSQRIGRKILVSGGGRCNFTNRSVEAANYISANPHFCRSALARYTSADFLALVERHGIAWHERKHGQLFCNESAKDIVAMLLRECAAAQVQVLTQCSVHAVRHADALFHIDSSLGAFAAPKLVIATGGLALPTTGASDFAYRLARQFGLAVLPTFPALVPLTIAAELGLGEASGIAVDARLSCNRAEFQENLLFTHGGISGPATLQISSYWSHGDALAIDLLPAVDVTTLLSHARSDGASVKAATLLAEHMPKRIVHLRMAHTQTSGAGGTACADLSNAAIASLAAAFHEWQLTPTGSEGYRKAEVTRGGVDTRALSSQTMEARNVPGLYVIGEAVDVTGWLGGYNFQWAWSSGYAAGNAL